MKLTKNKIIIGGIAVVLIGIWVYNRYRSKSAIEQVKEDELSAPKTTVPEIPKMYIRAGTNVPTGAMSFAAFEKNSF